MRNIKRVRLDKLLGGDRAGLLDWVSRQRAEFRIADVAISCLGIEESELTRDIYTRIGIALNKLGCKRIERRLNTKGRYWYRAPDGIGFERDSLHDEELENELDSDYVWLQFNACDESVNARAAYQKSTGDVYMPGCLAMVSDDCLLAMAAFECEPLLRSEGEIFARGDWLVKLIGYEHAMVPSIRMAINRVEAEALNFL